MSRQPHPTVPKLDLAPKLNRPLSLWNPLDYLQLLYWVFYFPQALRWYIDTFGGGYIPNDEMNPARGAKILRDNPAQRYLLLQGLILTIVTPLIICFGIGQFGVAIEWGGVAFGVALGVAVGVACCQPVRLSACLRPWPSLFEPCELSCHSQLLSLLLPHPAPRHESPHIPTPRLV